MPARTARRHRLASDLPGDAQSALANGKTVARLQIKRRKQAMLGKDRTVFGRVHAALVAVCIADTKFATQRIARVGCADVSKLALAVGKQHTGKVCRRADAQFQARGFLGQCRRQCVVRVDAQVATDQFRRRREHAAFDAAAERGHGAERSDGENQGDGKRRKLAMTHLSAQAAPGESDRPHAAAAGASVPPSRCATAAQRSASARSCVTSTSVVACARFIANSRSPIARPVR